MDQSINSAIKLLSNFLYDRYMVLQEGHRVTRSPKSMKTVPLAPPRTPQLWYLISEPPGHFQQAYCWISSHTCHTGCLPHSLCRGSAHCGGHRCPGCQRDCRCRVCQRDRTRGKRAMSNFRVGTAHPGKGAFPAPNIRSEADAGALPGFTVLILPRK